ncbi:hypothetical protein IKF32_00385 [Candidatus Saccharibacteria bacterium]|nr:hypothetical protein [Candidatus Saccharibacteria bacterium]
MKLNIYSKSIDRDTGSARIVIEGQLTIPGDCDDPIVELFRPIRATLKNKMLYTILVTRQCDTISCTLYPSNNKGQDQETFIGESLKYLPGVLSDYEVILNLYFQEKTGLDTFRKWVEKEEYAKANESIKKFITDIGLTMPSLKPKEKIKKTKAQKRAEGKEYQKAHPEVIKTKKPAK